MRLIDADALIRVLKGRFERFKDLVPNIDNSIEFAHRYALNSVTNAPTISEGWIPCSKKMPDEDGEYLVTFNGKFIDNIIKVMFYEVEKKFFSLYFPGAGDITFPEVRAWMPLPKPYREESEVEE